MKYVLTALGIFVFVATQAQNPPPAWNFGVKADANFSTINGKGLASGYTLGFQGGVYAEYMFTKQWSVQPELLFTQNNSKRSDNFSTYYVTEANPFAATDIKLAYLSVPVLLKYNINPAFSVLAGPEYSQLIVDAESLLSSGSGKAFKKNEFSGNLGAQFNAGRVSIYGRYNLGISNICNVPESNYAWHSSHLQIGLAIRLN